MDLRRDGKDPGFALEDRMAHLAVPLFQADQDRLETGGQAMFPDNFIADPLQQGVDPNVETSIIQEARCP